jgi:hypothetical protein
MSYSWPQSCDLHSVGTGWYAFVSAISVLFFCLRARSVLIGVVGCSMSVRQQCQVVQGPMWHVCECNCFCHVYSKTASLVLIVCNVHAACLQAQKACFCPHCPGGHKQVLLRNNLLPASSTSPLRSAWHCFPSFAHPPLPFSLSYDPTWAPCPASASTWFLPLPLLLLLLHQGQVLSPRRSGHQVGQQA